MTISDKSPCKTGSSHVAAILPDSRETSQRPQLARICCLEIGGCAPRANPPSLLARPGAGFKDAAHCRQPQHREVEVPAVLVGLEIRPNEFPLRVQQVDK